MGWYLEIRKSENLMKTPVQQHGFFPSDGSTVSDLKCISLGFRDALREVLRSAGCDENQAESIDWGGNDPVYRSQYKAVTGGAAALGAMGCAMADLREIQIGCRPKVLLEAPAVAASMRSSRYVLVDGKPAYRPPVMTGFFRADGERWNYFHCNHPPHQAALLQVLKVTADRARVADAARRWNAFALEDAVNAAGGLAPVVRTPSEWNALPNTRSLALEPLIEIRKIADSPPIPVPKGLIRPLTGLRVLDFTRVLAGPTCGRLLAESGADVLKITCERHPDYDAMEWDTGYGKRTAILDIASPTGRARLMDLLSTCDVFSQAYRPGALRRLGFGVDDLSALRPGIVCVNLTAFGYTGDWRARRGFDTVVQAASGMAHISGDRSGPEFMPVSALDYIAGYLMTFGTLVALRRRHEVGGSYAVNVSLARCAQWLISLGLHDLTKAMTGEEEIDNLADWLVEVPSPLGRLRRLRPIVRYSENALNELPAWTRRRDSVTWMT